MPEAGFICVLIGVTSEEDEPMEKLFFIAILIGAAGVAGGIETGSMVGTISAAVIHIVGIVGMVFERRVKGDDETDEDEVDDCGDPDGSSPVDKPYGTCSGRHAADH